MYVDKVNKENLSEAKQKCIKYFYEFMKIPFLHKQRDLLYLE